MLSHLCPLLVTCVKECALGDENLRVDHVRMLEYATHRRVAQIRDQRDLSAILNRHAALAQCRQLRAWPAHIFFLEFLAYADQRISKTAAAVVRLQGADEKVAA